VTYALGRGPTASDEPALAQIAQAFAARGGRFADLALAVTESDLFVKRRGELEEGGAP
jgi:hypothetical protein